MAGELNLSIRLNAEQAQQALNQLQAKAAETKNRFKEFSDRVDAVAQALRTMAAYSSEAFSRMVESTARVEAHNAALNRLGAAYELVRARTNDAVTAEQAVRVQQQLTQAGYRVTAEQLATITARAREYAIANGTDLNQALDQVTETLRGLSGEGLQRYGIQLTNAHTRGDAFRQAISQMDGQLRRSGTTMQTTAESADVLRRNWTQMQDGIIGRIAGWLQLAEAIRGVNDILDGTFARMQRANGMTGHDDMAGREAAANRLNNAGARRYFDANSLGRLNTHDAHQVAWYVEHGDIEGARRAMGLGQAQRDEQNARDTVAAAGGPANDNGTPTATERLRYGSASSGSRTSDSLTAASFGGSSGFASAMSAIGGAMGGGFGFGGIGGMVSEEMAAEAALAQAVVESERLKREARQATLDAEKEQHRQHEELREQERANTAKREAAMADAAIGRDTLQTQLNERFQAHAELHETRAQGMAGLVEGAYNSMTGALRTHIAAVITGRESIGEAIKATLQEVLLALAVESAVKAIFQTAEGIGAAAIGNYPGALQHFTSAGIYAAVAAGAGLGYAGVSAIGGGEQKSAGGFGAGSPGAAASTRGPSGAANDNGGGVMNVYVNGFAMTEAGVQDAVVGAVELGAMRGRRVRGLQYAA
jgi:hypothetical protein